MNEEPSQEPVEVNTPSEPTEKDPWTENLTAIEDAFATLADAQKALADAQKTLADRMAQLEGVVSHQIRKTHFLGLDICTLRQQLQVGVTPDDLKQTELKMENARRSAMGKIVTPGNFRVPTPKG